MPTIQLRLLRRHVTTYRTVRTGSRRYPSSRVDTEETVEEQLQYQDTDGSWTDVPTEDEWVERHAD